MKKILYITSESFPYGKAYASRTRAIVKAMVLANYEVTILCDQKNEKETLGGYTVEQAFKKQYKGLIKRCVVPSLYARRLDTMLYREHYDLVISRSMYDRYREIRKVVRKHGIPFVLESCECYNVKSFKRGRFDYRYRQFLRLWDKTRFDVDGVIAISRYIEQYYNKYCPVIRVPGILDIDYLSVHEPTWKKPIKLIYSGDISGGKEVLETIIQAVGQFPGEFVFDIYGPTKEQVIDTCTMISSQGYIGENVFVHGRVPQESLYGLIAESDIGIFIRPNRVSSEAGFPTKLGEYMASGLPVITNQTGDIPLILKNRFNGFLLQNGTTEEIIETLNSIKEMTDEELDQMSKNAINTVREDLVPASVSDDLHNFIDRIIGII